jgi:hypothetical protein
MDLNEIGATGQCCGGFIWDGYRSLAPSAHFESMPNKKGP